MYTQLAGASDSLFQPAQALHAAELRAVILMVDCCMAAQKHSSENNLLGSEMAEVEQERWRQCPGQIRDLLLGRGQGGLMGETYKHAIPLLLLQAR